MLNTSAVSYPRFRQRGTAAQRGRAHVREQWEREASAYDEDPLATRRERKDRLLAFCAERGFFPNQSYQSFEDAVPFRAFEAGVIRRLLEVTLHGEWQEDGDGHSYIDWSMADKGKKLFEQLLQQNGRGIEDYADILVDQLPLALGGASSYKQAEAFLSDIVPALDRERIADLIDGISLAVFSAIQDPESCERLHARADELRPLAAAAYPDRRQRVRDQAIERFRSAIGEGAAWRIDSDALARACDELFRLAGTDPRRTDPPFVGFEDEVGHLLDNLASRGLLDSMAAVEEMTGLSPYEHEWRRATERAWGELLRRIARGDDASTGFKSIDEHEADIRRFGVEFSKEEVGALADDLIKSLLAYWDDSPAIGVTRLAELVRFLRARGIPMSRRTQPDRNWDDQGQPVGYRAWMRRHGITGAEKLEDLDEIRSALGSFELTRDELFEDVVECLSRYREGDPEAWIAYWLPGELSEPEQEALSKAATTGAEWASKNPAADWPRLLGFFRDRPLHRQDRFDIGRAGIAWILGKVRTEGPAVPLGEFFRLLSGVVGLDDFTAGVSVEDFTAACAMFVGSMRGLEHAEDVGQNASRLGSLRGLLPVAEAYVAGRPADIARALSALDIPVGDHVRENLAFVMASEAESAVKEFADSRGYSIVRCRDSIRGVFSRADAYFAAQVWPESVGRELADRLYAAYVRVFLAYPPPEFRFRPYPPDAGRPLVKAAWEAALADAWNRGLPGLAGDESNPRAPFDLETDIAALSIDDWRKVAPELMAGLVGRRDPIDADPEALIETLSGRAVDPAAVRALLREQVVRATFELGSRSSAAPWVATILRQYGPEMDRVFADDPKMRSAYYAARIKEMFEASGNYVYSSHIDHGDPVWIAEVVGEVGRRMEAARQAGKFPPIVREKFLLAKKLVPDLFAAIAEDRAVMKAVCQVFVQALLTGDIRPETSGDFLWPMRNDPALVSAMVLKTDAFPWLKSSLDECRRILRLFANACPGFVAAFTSGVSKGRIEYDHRLIEAYGDNSLSMEGLLAMPCFVPNDEALRLATMAYLRKEGFWTKIPASEYGTRLERLEGLVAGIRERIVQDSGAMDFFKKAVKERIDRGEISATEVRGLPLLSERSWNGGRGILLAGAREWSACTHGVGAIEALFAFHRLIDPSFEERFANQSSQRLAYRSAVVSAYLDGKIAYADLAGLPYLDFGTGAWLGTVRRVFSEQPWGTVPLEGLRALLARFESLLPDMRQRFLGGQNGSEAFVYQPLRTAYFQGISERYAKKEFAYGKLVDLPYMDLESRDWLHEMRVRVSRMADWQTFVPQDLKATIEHFGRAMGGAERVFDAAPGPHAMYRARLAKLFAFEELALDELAAMPCVSVDDAEAWAKAMPSLFVREARQLSGWKYEDAAQTDKLFARMKVLVPDIDRLFFQYNDGVLANEYFRELAEAVIGGTLPVEDLPSRRFMSGADQATALRMEAVVVDLACNGDWRSHGKRLYGLFEACLSVEAIGAVIEHLGLGDAAVAYLAYEPKPHPKSAKAWRAIIAKRASVHAVLPELIAQRGPTARAEFCPYKNGLEPLVNALHPFHFNLKTADGIEAFIAYVRRFGFTYLPKLAAGACALESLARRPLGSSGNEEPVSRDGMRPALAEARTFLGLPEHAPIEPEAWLKLLETRVAAVRQDMLEDRPLSSGVFGSELGMEIFNVVVPHGGAYQRTNNRSELIAKAAANADRLELDPWFKPATLPVRLFEERAPDGGDASATKEERDARRFQAEIAKRYRDSEMQHFVGLWDAAARQLALEPTAASPAYWFGVLHGKWEEDRRRLQSKLAKARSLEAPPLRGIEALEAQVRAFDLWIERVDALRRAEGEGAPSGPGGLLAALQGVFADGNGHVDREALLMHAASVARSLFLAIMAARSPGHLEAVQVARAQHPGEKGLLSTFQIDAWSEWFREEYVQHFADETQNKALIAPELKGLMHALWRTKGIVEALGESKAQRKAPLNHPLVRPLEEIAEAKERLDRAMRGDVDVVWGEVGFWPVKGIGRAMAGDIANACYDQHHDALANGDWPGLTAVLMTLPGRAEIAGSFLIVDAKIEERARTAGGGIEKRAFVIRALNPSEAVIQRELDAGSLLDAAVRYVVDAAEASGDVEEVRVCLSASGGHSTNRTLIAKAISEASVKGPWPEGKALVDCPETNFNGYAIHLPGKTVVAWRRPVEGEGAVKDEPVSEASGWHGGDA